VNEPAKRATANGDPHEPIHEPALPFFDEEARQIHDAAERFEHASAQELLEWSLERFHPRMAISAAGGVDGMAIIDMAWRINPQVRVFTLDTGRLPPETYQLFEDVSDR
jgi:3'-phosphoadenosine 5'-phosphosulfate sulfotransferase (PAPS reductase)/FAD synthetase